MVIFIPCFPRFTPAPTSRRAGANNANYYAKVERGDADPAFVRLNRVLKVLKIKSLVE